MLSSLDSSADNLISLNMIRARRSSETSNEAPRPKGFFMMALSCRAVVGALTANFA